MNTENKLPEDFKQQWVAALRSGEYKQGRNTMRNPKDNSYCCLGVAGRVCGIPNELLDENAFFLSFDTTVISYSYPALLCDMDSVCAELASRNDNGESFPNIADYIEQNL